MSEKRKSCLVMMLRFRGKRHKIELFQASQWDARFFTNLRRGVFASKELLCRFRVRLNGRWFDSPKGPMAVTRSEFRDLLMRSLKPTFDKLQKDAKGTRKR